MEAQILTHQFYPIMKNIFKHLDVESSITLFNVSKQIRENLTNHFKFNTFNDNDWLDFFHIKIPMKESTVTLYELGDIEDLRKFLRKQHAFIDTFKEQLIKIDNRLQIIDYRKLSEDFVRRNFKYVDTWKISGLVKLSEDFIREYRNYLYWDMICRYQSLSIEFIKEHRNFVNWAILIKYNRIPTKHFYSITYQFKKEIKIGEISLRIYDDFHNFPETFYWELKDEYKFK